MRDSSFDSQTFCTQLEVLTKSVEKSSIFDRSSVSDSPKWHRTDFENDFRIKTQNLDDLISLAIFSWYIDPGLGILLRFAIKEKMANNFDLEILEFFLDSKGEMLTFLIETNLWHTRDFFGNLYSVKRLQKLLRYKLRFKFKDRKRPKRVQRHRGYRDKGTLRKPEDHHDFGDYRIEQLQLDEKRKKHSDGIFLLRGFLT